VTQVSSELIRVSILWHEMWHEALEEASRLYFGEQNVEGMLGVLLPLHEKIEQEQAVTLKEISFVQVSDSPHTDALRFYGAKVYFPLQH
jgi:FKBP12-rapamycin complex-associated protein